MLLFELRQRTGWLFLAVTIGHLVMISAQVTTGRGVPILEEGAFGLFAELQRASSYTVGGVQGFWSNYVGLRAVHRDNEQLRREVADLRVQLQGERSLAQQSRLLQGVLELRSSLRFTTAAATVIAGGASPDFRTVTIDKGTGSGVGPDMAVISPLGVVGRVVTPGARRRSCSCSSIGTRPPACWSSGRARRAWSWGREPTECACSMLRVRPILPLVTAW